MAFPDGRRLTVAAYKDWARDQRTEDNDVVGASIQYAEDRVDQETARYWHKVADDDEAAPRRYTPHSSCAEVLVIHDCTEITSVVENGITLTEDVDYVAEPFDMLLPNGRPLAYTHLRRLGTRWYYDCGRPTVTVTAKWGQVEIPAAITEADKYVTNANLQGRKIEGGIVAVTEVGGLSERDAKTVRDMVRMYSRKPKVNLA